MRALRVEGRRHDCGSTAGVLRATVALGLAHPELGPDFAAFVLETARALEEEGALAEMAPSDALLKGAKSGVMAGTPPAPDTGPAHSEDAEFGATGDAESAEALAGLAETGTGGR